MKSVLKTAVYVLDQADRTATDVRDRVNEGVDRVTDRVSDVTDQGRRVIYGENHTARNAAFFIAGIGLGVGAGIMLAPASGEETRRSVRRKVEDIGDRVRDSVPGVLGRRATGTDDAVV